MVESVCWGHKGSDLPLYTNNHCKTKRFISVKIVIRCSNKILNYTINKLLILKLYLSRKSRSSMDKDVSCAFVFDSVVDVVMIALTNLYLSSVKHSYLDVNDILV